MKLEVKSFTTHSKLIEWVNENIGADDIVSIILNQEQLCWYLFYREFSK